MNQDNTAEEITDNSLQPKQERKRLRRLQKEAAREKELKRKQTKKIITWGTVAVIIIGAVATTIARKDDSKVDNSPVSGVESDISDHVKGNHEAKVTVIEYADFQCPACASYHQIVSDLEKELGNQVQFIFRHFPLKQIHPTSEIAAHATEAAGIQGKFWEYADLLFEKQTEWGNESDIDNKLGQYAKQLELDVNKFKQDLSSDKIKDKVDTDYKGAIKLKLNSTPSFLINGEKIDNPRSFNQFKSILEEAVAKNS